GDTAHEIIRKILDQADAATLRRERRVARDADLWTSIRQKVRRKIWCRSMQIDMLDTTGDLGLGRIGEFELVEDIARDARIVVWVPQTIEQRAGIIRARRGQFLMTGLQPERRRDRRKAGVKRHHLHFNAAFLLLVGERLT